MSYKIGIITKYDGHLGIVSNGLEEYIFFHEDLQDNITISSFVLFRGEQKEEIKRAYFIRDLKKVMQENNNLIAESKKLINDIRKRS